MSIGTPVTKDLLDQQMGEITRGLEKVMRQLGEMHSYFLATPDATLTAMGYASDEVATIKSAFTDGETLRLIFQGVQALAVAQDFQLNLLQLAGTRVTD